MLFIFSTYGDFILVYLFRSNKYRELSTILYSSGSDPDSSSAAGSAHGCRLPKICFNSRSHNSTFTKMYAWYSTGSTTVISSCQPTMTHRSRMLYMYQDCLFLSNIYQRFSSVCKLKNIKARNLILPWKPCCLSFLFFQVLHENSGHLLTKCYLLNLFLHCYKPNIS